MKTRSVLSTIVIVGTAGLVLAQSRPSQILHEPIPDVATDHPAAAIGGAKGAGNPTAFNAGDKVLPKPSLDAGSGKRMGSAGSGGEPVLGSKDFSADRATTMRPDENTGSDGTLHYVSVFNPDVLPFKRMSTFDAVGDDFTLHVARTVLTELPVGGTTDPRTRDRFWGDVLVELRPGTDVPLPSVAPDMRILSYEAKPAVRLKFSKDGADNFYVRSDEPSASGTYRVVFFADADFGYFAPQLPPHTYRVRDIANRAPDELKPVIPAEVAREAKVTLQRLGIDRDMDLSTAFNKLVSWGRSFQAGTIANPSGNTYRDLCDSKVGVCRHRAFAFMVTANALGIPTRLVENEAHAFVEVWFPERNWQRIDLGGAALRMDVSGMDSKTLHRPRADDPFAKPSEYKQNYTQLEGDIKGVTPQQIADKHKPLDQAPPSGAPGPGPGTSPTPDRITPDPTLPVVTQDPKKGSPRLLVTQAATTGYRGDVIHIEGLVRVDGRPLPDHLVRVYLAPAGEGGKNSIPIGPAKTGADGTFRDDFSLPPSLHLTTYEIYLSSDEDPYYNAALSD